MARANPQSNPNAAALRELAYFPALTLIVFVRRRVGLRLLRPDWIVRTFILLQLYAIVGVPLMRGTLLEMRVIQWFSFAFLIAAIAHYWRSWREFNKGIRLHTYSSGVSYLDRSSVPRFLRWHRRVYRFLDPLFCLVFACYVLVISHPIGIWLVVSSFSLRFFEQARYEAAIDRDFDIVDGLAEADIQQQTVEFFSAPQSRGRASNRQALSQQGGIPTGIAPDIATQISNRNKEAAKNHDPERSR